MSRMKQLNARSTDSTNSVSQKQRKVIKKPAVLKTLSKTGEKKKSSVRLTKHIRKEEPKTSKEEDSFESNAGGHARSLIGLDGDSDVEVESGLFQRKKINSKEKRSSKESSDKSLSEEKESVSLAENEEEREKYRLLFKELCLQSDRTSLDDSKEEYDALPHDPGSDECKAFYDKVNAKKNRYNNIPCLDSSRVKLSFLAKSNDSGSDYIHANYVTSRFLENKYIVTQGPKKTTIYDFWRMVWQEKSTVIIMLCQFIEHNREKCAEYLPSTNNPFKFDQLHITFQNSTLEKRLRKTKLKLIYRGESRTIAHYQWLDWPDYEVPGSSQIMLRLLGKARNKPTPPIVHCAAGVGRSGTFVAIEIALKSINNHFELPDFQQIVSDLRTKCRCSSVQTLAQYMMIRKIVLDFGSANGLLKEDNYSRFSAAYHRAVHNRASGT